MEYGTLELWRLAENGILETMASIVANLYLKSLLLNQIKNLDLIELNSNSRKGLF